jgi:hypothetical protein
MSHALPRRAAFALLTVASALATLTACDEENACDRYADYVCECHEGDSGFDCDALRALAEAPTETTIDQCAIDLADQEAADEADGAVCVDTAVAAG